MRLHLRSNLIGAPAALMLLAVSPSSATVLPNFEPSVGVQFGNSPQPVLVSQTFNTSASLPESVISPATFTSPATFISPATSLSPATFVPENWLSPAMVPSSLPAENEYDFVSNPGVNAPSVFFLPSITPSIYQVVPAFQPALVGPTPLISPVPLLYTGPQNAPYSAGGVPLIMDVTTPATPANNLFTAAPETPDVTTNFNNSPLNFGPAFAVPEPRLASLMAVAAALALGVLVARRRKKEALPKP